MSTAEIVTFLMSLAAMAAAIWSIVIARHANQIAARSVQREERAIRVADRATAILHEVRVLRPGVVRHEMMATFRNPHNTGGSGPEQQQIARRAALALGVHVDRAADDDEQVLREVQRSPLVKQAELLEKRWRIVLHYTEEDIERGPR